jgi:uncharacterized membrane protein YfcA
MTGIMLLALPAGVIIATLASAVGIGGGILWMPFFHYFLEASPGDCGGYFTAGADGGNGIG